MSNVDAYNATAGLKAQAISENQSKVHDMVQGHKAFARAVSHLNAQSERGLRAPKTPFDPLQNGE